MKVLYLLSSLAVINAQRMATSYGQRLHPDFFQASSTFRNLQDCSGQGETWGSGLGPPPEGCAGRPPDADGGGGGGSSGVGDSVTSTSCDITSGTCNTDGSTNSGSIRDLTYSASAGIFTRTITTNQCNDHERIIPGGGSAPGNNAV